MAGAGGGQGCIQLTPQHIKKSISCRAAQPTFQRLLQRLHQLGKLQIPQSSQHVVCADGLPPRILAGVVGGGCQVVDEQLASLGTG